MYKIPMNVPVFIQDVVQDDERALYSKAKLKVFYIGETADHRLFTKDFSEKVIETLPLTPVVGFYSEDDEDFVGHNSVQYVYGVVPESAKITFEEDENDKDKVFAVTDVILYTGRKDNIGTVAKKIVGKQHSLELDPTSLKYKINRDPQGKFMNIEFISGELVGLSVLGDNEKPAFSGSEFFTTNEGYEEMLSTCQDKFNKFFNLLNSSGGKIEVFNSEAFFNKCAENFAKITMQEFTQRIYAALEAKEIYGYIVENTDEYAVVSQWNYDLNRHMYAKYSLTTEGDKIILGEPIEVYAKYLTQEEIDAVDSINTAKSLEKDNKQNEEDFAANNEENNKKDDENDDDNDDNNDDDNNNNNNDDDNNDDDNDDEEDDSNSNYVDSTVDVNADDSSTTNSDTDAQGENVANAKESDENNKKEEEEEENGTTNQVDDATASNCVATLSDAERTELEQYRRDEKLRMIADYKSDLSKEVIDDFTNNVDSFTKEELESKLAIEFRKIAKAKQTTSGSSVVTTFGLLNIAGQYNENDPADVINRYKN